jgi:hypothetical protein
LVVSLTDTSTFEIHSRYALCVSLRCIFARCAGGESLSPSESTMGRQYCFSQGRTDAEELQLATY